MFSLKDLKIANSEIEIFSHPIGTISLRYVRSSHLKLTAFITVSPGKQFGRSIQVHGLSWPNRFSQEPLIESIHLLCIQCDEYELLECRKLIDHFRKLYVSGKNARRTIYQAQRKLVEDVKTPFESTVEIQRIKGNYSVSLFHQNVIDLDNPGDKAKDSEYIKLSFVKNKLGFGLAVDYRLLKHSEPGSNAGRVELTTNPPETINGLYGVVRKALIKLESMKHLHPKRTEEILPIITRFFNDKTVALDELLMRHHTFHV